MKWFLVASTLLALSWSLAQGEGIYQSRCAVCHGAKGEGHPGVYPPLAGSLGRLLALEEARAYLIWVTTYGLSGPIRSGGVVYNGVMLAYPGLSAAERADLLNHLLALNAGYLPGGFRRFTPEEVQGFVKDKKTPAELRHLRESLIARLQQKGLPVP